jgi:hypothetical protein
MLLADLDFLGFVFASLLAIIFGAICLWLKIKTPAFEFLRASRKGIPLLGVITKAGMIDFRVGRMSSGTIQTKKYGEFVVTPGSMYPSTDGKVPFGVAYSDYGATMNPRMFQAFTDLKEKGFENIDEAEEFFSRQIECEKCGFNGWPIVKEIKEGKRIIDFKLLCPTCKDEGKIKVKKNLTLDTPNNKTIRFQDVIGMFKYNINPNFIRARIERRAAELMAGLRKPPFVWIILIIGLIMTGAVAYILINQAGCISVSECTGKVCQAVVAQAQTAWESTTATTVPTGGTIVIR